MKRRKKLYLSLIIFVIITFYIWFVILDFTRFTTQNYSYDIYPSALLKRLCVILAAVIAWSVGRDRLNTTDGSLMKAVFIFIILGEAAFIVWERLAGVGMFSVCQTLLTVRNSTGFINKLKSASYKQKLVLVLTGIFLLLLLTVFPFVFASQINISTAIVIVYLYGIILSISLWAGLACNILSLLPKRNSRMVAVGMPCFYCCDILVGLDAVMEAGIPWLFANSFIWIFYIPALVLLALSCYRYERISSIDKRTNVLHNINNK